MYYHKDITGQKFGALTALYPTEERDTRKCVVWMFQCDCGKEVKASSYSVKRGYIRSCGCGIDGRRVNSKFSQRNLLGNRFGSLTVVEQKGETNKFGSYISKVRCDCGVEFMAKDYMLINGRTTRCRFCYYKTKEKYSVKNDRLLGIWREMRLRCNSPSNPRYSSYGGRGISVCDEWNDSFESFYNWAMTNGYQEDLTIDRINNNGNYEPSNCRWTTYAVQSVNKRTTVFMEYNGQKMPLRDVAKLTGIPYKTLNYRRKSGWSDYDATHIPPKGA